jgi:ribosomal-protein-alanine N-acetyltransferase
MSRTPITIRTASLKDLPTLISLSEVAGEAAHWSPAQWEDIFHTETAARQAWLAQSPEGPCGFLVANCGVHVAGAPPEWELENIAVSSLSRRHGIGRQLLEAMRMAAEEAGASRILLEVRESNVAARKLYEASGFHLLSRRTGYYEGPAEDALVLVHVCGHTL